MILYFRSYLITLGMLMAGGGAFAFAVAQPGCASLARATANAKAPPPAISMPSVIR